MEDKRDLCETHQKYLKYYCAGPCNFCYCVCGAKDHMNNFIRDLVSNPVSEEISALEDMRKEHVNKIEKVEQNRIRCMESFNEISTHKENQLQKIARERNALSDLIKEKFNTAIKSITEEAEGEKKKINTVICNLDKTKNKSEDCIRAIDYILKENSEKIIKNTEYFGKFLACSDDTPEIPKPRLKSFQLFQDYNKILDGL